MRARPGFESDVEERRNCKVGLFNRESEHEIVIIQNDAVWVFAKDLFYFSYDIGSLKEGYDVRLKEDSHHEEQENRKKPSEGSAI